MRNSALSSKAVPIYVFYNHLKFTRENLRPWPTSFWGCSYSPISELRALDNPEPSDIPTMFPWHLLFFQFDCIDLIFGLMPGGSQFPSNVAHSLKRAYSNEPLLDRRGKQVEESFFVPRNKPPQWVTELLALEGGGRREPRREVSEGLQEGEPPLEAYLKENKLAGVALFQYQADERKRKNTKRPKGKR